jgi:hypothetical protein
VGDQSAKVDVLFWAYPVEYQLPKRKRILKSQERVAERAPIDDALFNKGCLERDTGTLSGFDVAVQESENMLTENLS